ncbi:MAG: Asp-tRNA(Asn)/Glu-tRNA(Gln) amidotransferase GatCAB subunit B, partial [Planctomycetaceae bacterium]|nr:Asp-tRNA(Asn)/Glu-tRNA(Gln) amidotransferase GatCAB subunit B [Planctomycetaceae bacterium]
TRSMRSKEAANDYRYFPEPDLPPLSIDEDWVTSIRRSLPEMPDARLARFLKEYAIKREDAEAIVDTREVADFFENCVKLLNEPQKVANWIGGEVARALNELKVHFRGLNLTPKQLTGLIALLDDGKLNNITAKEVFADMIANGGEPLDVARRLNKLIETDDAAVDKVIDEVLKEFDKAAADLRSGKEAALGFLVGQCMRKLRGKGNPKDLGKRIMARISV